MIIGQPLHSFLIIVVTAYNTLLPMLQPGRKLDPKLRELVILRTGIVGDPKFEYSQHMKVARTVGVPEESSRRLRVGKLVTSLLQ